MFRVLVAVIGCLAGGVVLVSARQEPKFRSGSDTVSIYATVLDQTGRLVPGLTREDFEVYDNGKRQSVTVFANDLQPITIVIMLDRSRSMEDHFDLVRKAAERFVEHLEPTDRARVGSFANRIEIDPEEFTSDHLALVGVLRTKLQPAGITPLWRATSLAMTALKDEPGRRVVLLFTDGHDTPDAQSPMVTYKEIRTRSVAENVMVYGIGFTSGCGQAWGGGGGSWYPRPRYQRRRPPGGLPPVQWPRPPMPRPRPPVLPTPGDGGTGRYPPPPMPDRSLACQEAGPDPDLRELANVGGGGYFELTNTDDLATTFGRVADELHQQYLLAFTPERLDGETHQLEIRVKNSTLTARARQSYVASED
jgi:VWFA-related protein